MTWEYTRETFNVLGWPPETLMVLGMLAVVVFLFVGYVGLPESKAKAGNDTDDAVAEHPFME